MADLKFIEKKIIAGERLSREDGVALFKCNDLAWLGYMADIVRKRISGEYVYYNVNRHINLTNICTARCKFCAFGCDQEAGAAYAMTKEEVLAVVAEAAEDPDLQSLHIVSGLHPKWPFDYFTCCHCGIYKMKRAAFRHLSAFWVMLTLPLAQLALGFGANDIDGTIKEEKIMHAAGAKSSTALTSDKLVAAIKETGRIPVECDCNFKIIKILADD